MVICSSFEVVVKVYVRWEFYWEVFGRSGKWVLEKTMVEELIEELQSTVEAIVL